MKQVYSFEELLAEKESFIKLYSRRLNQTVIILNDEATIEHHSGTYALYRVYEVLAMRHLSDQELSFDNQARRTMQGIPLQKSELSTIKKQGE